MTQQPGTWSLRPCEASDSAFLHDVFATTWQSQVAALPNQKLAQHVLRIQHFAQERRFSAEWPGHRRMIITVDGEDAGRIYVHDDATRLHLVDITLLPRFRSRGIGSRMVRDLCAEAAHQSRTVSLRVVRSGDDVTGMCLALGFRVVSTDDLANHLEWVPEPAGPVLGGQPGRGAGSVEHAPCPSSASAAE